MKIYQLTVDLHVRVRGKGVVHVKSLRNTAVKTKEYCGIIIIILPNNTTEHYVTHCLSMFILIKIWLT